jgi:HSP20 family protein
MDFSLFPRDVFAELETLQRQMQQAFSFSPSIRGGARGGFPALNVGSTPEAVEIYAFAPGLDPRKIELNIERGVLSIAGERAADVGASDRDHSTHLNERFSGRFHRVITLSDDLDPAAVNARYENGILRVSIRRRESAQPRRIDIQ